METPAHLPSRPRDFVDLLSDDEEGDDEGLEPPSPNPGHFPEIDNFGDLDDLIFGNLMRENQAAWDAVEFEAQRAPIPILGDWRNEVPRPVPGAAPDLPQMFRQAERLNLGALPVNPVNPVNEQADNELLNNDIDLIQEEINNQLNNDLLGENDFILKELNNQLLDEQIGNHNNNDNFVWAQVNLDLHNARQPIDLEPTEEMDNKARILQGVVDIFPDICLDYIDQLYTAVQGRKTVPAIVELVLEGEENGVPHPKLNQLKRKRPVESDEEEEIMRKYTGDQGHTSDKYLTLARGMLSEEFASTPMSFIMKQFHDSGMVIYTSYQKLAEAERLWDPSNPSYSKLKQARRIKNYAPHIVEEKLADLQLPPDQKRAYSEIKDVRMGRAAWEVKLTAKRQREADEAAAKEKFEADEAANLELAIKEGTMEDCGCCYDDFPRNRMVHCNNESISHYFCKHCARLHAETQIGSAKYELQCMSTDICEASYSHSQREMFLDQNLTTALDRIEAEAVLRLAGIENLASCPFCPYAAEYPPIEHERLFHCKLDSCLKTSCRLCQKESHIPKTCEENAKDIGLDVRREVEEAMTAAMVRLCNKCKGPFIKEEGCNKMNCPCGNIQCYVCSKSCQYNHFDDERRGGKAGNCPLFDDVYKRHEDEIKRAEEIIVEKLQKEHPEVTREDLEIRVSDAVKADEEARRKKRFLPYDPFRFRLDGGNGGAGPVPRMGDEERQAYREAFRVHMPPEHREFLNRVENPGQGHQPPNLQGAAAAPANPPAPQNPAHHRFRLHNRHRNRNPRHQALLDGARAIAKARADEALAANARRKELRDRLAAGPKDAPRDIGDELRERVDAVTAAGEAAAEAMEKLLEDHRAERAAAERPRRGEDGDAEVIYRPGDAVVPRRRMQDWVFEPFGPPVDGGGGRGAADAGNAGDVAREEAIDRAFAAAERAYNPLAKKDFRLRPLPQHHRQPFPLPRHPPRPDPQPEQPVAPWEKFLMQPLRDDYEEPNPLPWGPVMRTVDEGFMPMPRGRKEKEGETGAGAGGGMAQALGRFGRVGMGGVGVGKQEGGKQEGAKQEGAKQEEGGRKEGERGLDFLMRLRRGKSKSGKKEKAKGEEKK
ncbi:hypothetical protein VE03_05452 [Pseudogymnoascus sp. 23342-1-I1]|nr:hypothetical protein VE03_05452 [Pseudogymnoascus sp. 23342-1-I1]